RLAREQVDERRRDGGLVRDEQDVARGLVVHGTGTSSVVRAGARIACCAPTTPYSYGEPTTCGISSKLNVGGGEVTCHSSVIARQGLPGAIGPLRQLVIML